MAALELRPMGIGDILDMTFRLYRQRFGTFLLIALVVYVPYAALVAMMTPDQRDRTTSMLFLPEDHADQVAQREMLNQDMAANMQGAGMKLLAVAIFSIVLMPLCSAALIQNISASYLGAELSVGQSYSRATPRLLALIGSWFLATIVCYLGLICCIVPGIIFLLWFSVLSPVVVLECKAGSAAMRRSRELVRGNIDKAFVLGLVIFLLTFAISFGLGLLAGFVPGPRVVGIFVTNLLMALLLPIQTAPWILLYYDLRIRKEAFDLEQLAGFMGQSNASQSTAT